MPESSRRTDAPLSPDPAMARALALARAALEAEPAGLLTDFDGTLSPIVEDPFDARLADGAEAALAVLARRLAVVGIVTGREPLEARELVGVEGVLVAGNHGTEWLEPGSSVPVPAPGADAVRRALDEALARVPSLPGVVAQHKGSSAAVHYRQAPRPAEARDLILAALGDVSGLGLRATLGRMVVELRSPELGDKGSAARELVTRFGLRGVVVMGDDTSDLDMFAAVAGLRATGSVRGALIAVGGADEEVRPEVAAAADAVLPAPADVAALLTALAGH